MEPTISQGDIVIIRTAPDRVRAGDVVVFRLQDELCGPGRLLIKRVIAVGGDQTSRLTPNAGFSYGLIPQGHVFVASDNGTGYDSHTFGPIPLSSIVGVACGRDLD